MIVIIFSIPYFVLKVVGPDFYRYFINITYTFAIIGLIFYGLSLISPAFYNFTGKIAPALHTDPTQLPVGFPLGREKTILAFDKGFILYTFRLNIGPILRSAGPFWEPGAYAAFLVIALIFNIASTKSLLEKKSLVFIVALITTYSTSGYLSLFVIFLSYLLWGNEGKMTDLKFLLLPIVFVGVWYSYAHLPFLGDKISSLYDREMAYSLSSDTEGRFLSTERALYTIGQHPFFGRGLVKETAAAYGSQEALAYGIPAMMVRLGLIGFIMIYVGWYYGLKKILMVEGYNNKFAWTSLLAISIVLFSESLYFAPIYLMIFYFPFVHGDPADDDEAG